MGNWIDCVRSRKTPNASAEIGFRSAIAVHMANLAYRHQKCHPDSEGVTLKTAPAIPSYCSLLLSDGWSSGFPGGINTREILVWCWAVCRKR